MDALLFHQILSDKYITDLRRLNYKYPDVDTSELLSLLKALVYKPLPLQDFKGNDIVYMESILRFPINALKRLLTPPYDQVKYGIQAMEDEISSSFSVESIELNRDSVRKILRGYAPTDEQEESIYGMKMGLDFMSDRSNAITEDNIFALYDMAIGRYLDEGDKLNPGAYYRHDTVYIVGQDVEHVGLPHQKIPEYMGSLIEFINNDSSMNDLLKAAAIHFYVAYIHPYFDGNGRMARLMHIWYLLRQNYPAALYIPLSQYIHQSRSRYYAAFSLAEQNEKLSGLMDMTPFLAYFIEQVYDKLGLSRRQVDTLATYQSMLDGGGITVKERDLWTFVLSVYGSAEFSTKQLEKDFGSAAYATIRKFVLKFTDMGLLTARQYGSRVRYCVSKRK